MPELPEIEQYRRLAAAVALHRPVVDVVADDAWYLKGGLTAPALRTAVVGRSFVEARRIGKLLLLDTSGGGPTLGLRFGMTGHLLVDGVASIERLEWSSGRDLPAWDRVAFGFEDGGDLRIRDPRRLGGVLVDPDEARLGIDAMDPHPEALAAALGASTAPLKARLMDQARVAGVGNLLADEILWRAGLDPRRPAGSLSGDELVRLHATLGPTVVELLGRGGSHMGDLIAERRPGGRCPTDGTPLERATVGGRTTWWCPGHQR